MEEEEHLVQGEEGLIDDDDDDDDVAVIVVVVLQYCSRRRVYHRQLFGHTLGRKIKIIASCLEYQSHVDYSSGEREKSSKGDKSPFPIVKNRKKSLLPQQTWRNKVNPPSSSVYPLPVSGPLNVSCGHISSPLPWYWLSTPSHGAIPFDRP